MNRSNEMFSETPTMLDAQRSVFPRNSEFKCPMNSASLYPVYVDEILPGDTFSMDLSWFLRSSTPAFPVMDNSYIDFYAFFVPNRIVWNHWKQFNGENDTSYWTQSIEYTIPGVSNVDLTYGTTDHPNLGNYLYGIGSVNEIDYLNILPARAYAMIYNEWFRSEVVDSPVLFSKDDTDSSDIIKTLLENEPLKVDKFFDAYTSCLPEPQKGDAIKLPLGDKARVITSDDVIPASYPQPFLKWGSFTSGEAVGKGILGTNSYGDTLQYNAGSSSEIGGAVPINLYADLSNATAATINQLRFAFACQKYLERLAFGSRYREQLLSMWGVQSQDQTMQIPEYLGGFRQILNMSQVVATSNSTGSAGSVGSTGAVSVTGGKRSLFTKSFTEHGWVIVTACIRAQNTYFKGLEPMFTRRDKFDYYNPVFANIGNVPVKKGNIFYDSNHDATFGYQEAWWDYRYKQSSAIGIFESEDSFSYGQKLTAAPSLNSGFLKEDPSKIDKTLLVSTSASGYQYLADFHFNVKATREMPVYSVPGLIDHH